MAIATDGSEPILQARGLSVRYGPVVALDRVDVDVYPGEIVALAGENGAGKSTLVRCLAGDVVPDEGSIFVRGQALAAEPRQAARLGVSVVWQDLALCDNLDIAANLLLGRETRRLMFSASNFHRRATELLGGLGIDLPSTATPVAHLSGGQRQLVAVARAMRDGPSLLILDEPTAALGVAESARVEDLAALLPGQGTTVLIVTHDLEQMFRLADRIIILRRGRFVAQVRPSESHPDEVAALLSGQGLDLSARRQLTRLSSLADQLSSAAPSSSVTLIMSALSAALGVDQLCVHVTEGATLRLVGSAGLPARIVAILATLPVGTPGGPIGEAITTGQVVVSPEIGTDTVWARHRLDMRSAGVASTWSVPFTGPAGDSGVVTLMGRETGEPSRDDLELASLYAGYVASALERDRLLGEVTSRNRVLETIRDILQALAGPAPPETGLRAALRLLQSGLGATAAALLDGMRADHLVGRAWAGPDRDVTSEDHLPAQVVEAGRAAVEQLLSGANRVEQVSSGPSGEYLATAFPAPAGVASLVAWWQDGAGPNPERGPLFEDAANSFRLALEREASERAQRETMALRSSQELQRQFLSWLSHELRTPLTAIRGYASSLMQPDVDWDGSSQQRFLERISDESARLGRLVDDLLDFSAIDAGILRLQPDWCELPLVLEAARDCLPEAARLRVTIDCDPDLAVVWADHDRLEQIFVNLLENSVRHNPPDTQVRVQATPQPIGEVTITVSDNGLGMPADVGRPGTRPVRRGRTGGAGLGLSIARGIVDAHGGQLDIQGGPHGTTCAIQLPVALGAPADSTGEVEKVHPR
ncbi:MAG TPA: ATP-binding cassette domain-containing protein [Acidimicrobiales bacterium]|jgi:signal transduction histidine kinase/ABC-type multidrug transport system ATPase subunit|nr:ATP-binding cassette domain-containing protein [Acidimicrobiales bacterium]